jgi:hypothetical protein
VGVGVEVVVGVSVEVGVFVDVGVGVGEYGFNSPQLRGLAYLPVHRWPYSS